MSDKNYLENGAQTKITPAIQKLAEKFTSQNLGLIFEIIKYIDQNLPVKTEKKAQLFRNRTADEILKDRFSTGCTDSTLLFITLCRAKDIPTKYVELLSRQWLQSNNHEIVGHVVAEIKIHDTWYYVDPTHGSISIKRPSGMIVFDKGLDSWDIDITNQNWEEKFEEFRERKSNLLH